MKTRKAFITNIVISSEERRKNAVFIYLAAYDFFSTSQEFVTYLIAPQQSQRAASCVWWLEKWRINIFSTFFFFAPRPRTRRAYSKWKALAFFGCFRGRRETKPERLASILNKFPIISVVFDCRSSSAAAFSFTARLNSILFLFFFSILHPRSSKASRGIASLSARAPRRLEDNKFLISRLNFLFRPMDHRALSSLMIRRAQFNNSSTSVAFLRSQRATERAKEREKVKGSLHVKATHTGEWASSCSELAFLPKEEFELGLSPSAASSARLRLSSLSMASRKLIKQGFFFSIHLLRASIPERISGVCVPHFFAT